MADSRWRRFNTFFYVKAIRRAWRDTWKHVKAQVLVGVVLFGLAAWYQCASLPTGTACDVSSVRFGLYATLTYLGGVFLINLVMAPVRIHRELSSRIAGQTEQPLVVEYVSHEVRPDPLYVKDGWEFEAYQTAGGIGLAWQTRDSSFDRLSSAPLPAEVVCRTTPSAGGRSHDQSVRTKWRALSVECVFPKDFPGVTAATGSIEVEWQAKRNQTGWVNIPSLEVLRGQQRARTPADAEAERQAGEQVVTCATLSVKLRAKRGESLV